MFFFLLYASRSYTFCTYLHTWELPIAFIYWLGSFFLATLLKGTLSFELGRKESVWREVLIMLFTQRENMCLCLCMLGRYGKRADLCKRFPPTVYWRVQARACICWMTCLAETQILLLALFISYLLELIGLSLRLYFEPVKSFAFIFSVCKEQREMTLRIQSSDAFRKFHNTHLHQKINLSKPKQVFDVQMSSIFWLVQEGNYLTFSILKWACKSLSFPLI